MNLIHIMEVAFVFSFMIFIHEGGHYLACRLFGVEVEEFALGFGPTLFSRKWGKTLYALRSIPLGGFCKPQGGDLSGQSPEDMYAKAAMPGDFLFASWWKRVIIFIAGPGMNFISAILIVACLFLFQGEILPITKPLLGFVAPGSLADQAGLKQGDLLLTVSGKAVTNLEDAYDDLMPDFGKSVTVTAQRGARTIQAILTCPPKPASPWVTSDNGLLRTLASIGWAPSAAVTVPDLGIIDYKEPIVGQAMLGNPARNAGIQDGDKITAINGQAIGDWGQLSYVIKHAPEDALKVDFLRDGKAHEVTVRRVYNGEFKAIGISPVDSDDPKNEEIKHVSVFQALNDATKFSMNLSQTMLDGILKLVTGRIAIQDNVAGPVTIMRLMYDQAAQGWADLLHGVAVISLILFLMNLLPIPVVDGGQIVLCLIEGLKRGPVPVKIQMAYQQVGFFLVVALMGLAVFNDFKNIFLEVHNHIH